MSKITVIHHSADFDGLFCREIARKFLPQAELIGWDFADKPLAIPDGEIYVLDLPVDRPFGVKDFGPEGDRPSWFSRVVWIDHHKSSIDSHPTDIKGYRIDGVAACRLAWQWFNQGREGYALNVPSMKETYFERKVSEPLAVRLAGEYDVWDKRDVRAEVFQFGLRSREMSADDWNKLLAPEPPNATPLQKTLHNDLVDELLNNGSLLQRYQQRNDASTMRRSFIVEWEGLKFLALTTARCNSLTFASKDVPETGHDALMGFYCDGDKWNVSMYHAKHRMDLDLSKIAVKYGGGGHKGACGFQAATLPFLP